jgi:hypothetical protein
MAEPEWDQHSRDLALAHDALVFCDHCGNLRSVCTDPDRQDDWVAGDPIRCHAQTARLARQKGVTEDTNPNAEALSWPVHLRGGL